MEIINDFIQEISCFYKGEFYSVRDNGAVLRHSKSGCRKRKYDDKWTFGTSINEKGYPCIASEVIHRIVATAFLGEPSSKNLVVDHINTNRQDNRLSNLRWVTRLENIILNPITCKKIENLTGKDIKDVLEHIEILHNYSLPPNIEWMRNVSQSESDECLANLINWSKSEQKDKSSYNEKLGELIYQKKKNVPKLAYPDTSKKENKINLDVMKSLTSFAAQDRMRWKMPAEFPCCPHQISDKPLEDYIKRLKPGKIFCKTKLYKSLVLESSLYNNEIIVKTEQANQNAIKPWSICIISFENNLFVHRVYATCFNKDGADKFFLTLQGKEWLGGAVFDEFC